jgi:ketosteroid isomerase-like protein
MRFNEVIDVALRFVDCINHKDVDGIVDMLAPGHIFADLEGNEFEFDADSGRRAWQDYFQLSHRYLIHVGGVYALGDLAVLCGRTTGSHMELLHAQEFEQKLIWTADIRHEKLNDWRIYFDRLATRRRIGIPYIS